MAALALMASGCSQDEGGLVVRFENNTDGLVAVISLGGETFDQWRERATFISFQEPGSSPQRRFVRQPSVEPEPGEPWCLDKTTLYIVAPVNPSGLGEPEAQGFILEGLELEILAIDEAPCFPSPTGNTYSIQQALNEADS